ncbi:MULTISPECIES: aldo/keto reductase [Rhodomicrobium]|uniref:aldo/keto reductase n=1 Tax=Rhodomicrobium TaxID=1068 RepID=UPI001FDA10FC|nr:MULTISPECIES: aldo/keto reductase [Rhodomicrobium]
MAQIEKTTLGARGPEVSRLCLGTMMFGDQTDEGAAVEMIARYGEAGGNFIDTADQYANGASESIIGRAIAGQRDRWVVASKGGNPVKGVPGSGGLSARWLRPAVEQSLDRLGLDRIDVYYLHLDDEATPLEETIGVLGELMAAGKIGGWGFSNFRAWKIADMVRVADSLGVARPIAAQPYYHALYRLIEIDYLPACAHFGIGVVPYSPLARGLLTGKYNDGTPEGSRAARNDKRMMETEFRPEAIDAARKIAAHLAPSGRPMSGFALAWVLANKLVSGVVIGPKTMAQLEDYISLAATAYTAEDEAFMNQLVPSGSAAGYAYSDPRYPYRGRVFAG